MAAMGTRHRDTGESADGLLHHGTYAHAAALQPRNNAQLAFCNRGISYTAHTWLYPAWFTDAQDQQLTKYGSERNIR